MEQFHRRYFRKIITIRQQMIKMISNSKNTAINLPSIICPIIMMSLLAQTCFNTKIHETKYTNCSISFNTESNFQNITKTDLIFSNCTRHLCLRNLIDGHCTNLQKFQFEELKCYQECCGSNQYDFGQCEEFNEKRKIRMESNEEKLAIILVATFLGIFIAILIFVILYLQCCQKQETVKTDNQNINQNKWVNTNFTSDKKCLKCKQRGAFVVHSCGVFHHLKCMNDNQKWTCQRCQKSIKKVKVFCPICLNKSIVVRAKNFDELDKKIVQLYQFHPNKCFEEMEEEMDTQRKFTQTTKQ